MVYWFVPVKCRFALVCTTEAAPVFEPVRRDWCSRSSGCSGKSVKRTELLVWSRAEWAAAAAGSSQPRPRLRCTRRSRARSASSSAPRGGLAPAPAGSPAAVPSPERSRQKNIISCFHSTVDTQNMRTNSGFERLT